MSKSFQGDLPALSVFESALSKQLSDHVAMLAGDIGARSLTIAPDGLRKAAGYIEHILNKNGLKATREEFVTTVFDQTKRSITSDSIKFESKEHATWNVVAEIKGRTIPGEIVVVGAHYDSVYECPAANDNASGVAALLAIASNLAFKNLSRTLRLVAFTNEEPPFFHTDLMGSFVHAQRCKNNNEKIVAMVCLETIGYYTDEPDTQNYPHPILKLIGPRRGNFVAFISNFKSRTLLSSCVNAFRRSAKFPSERVILPEFVRGVRSSDHANFWKFKYKAVLVTDTANYRYPHYHEITDTPDKLDYDKIARVVAGLIATVETLCNSPSK